MATYNIVSGTTAVASDVQQLVNIFNGQHDIGTISLAPTISAPSSGSFSLTSQSGSSLGVGTYNYEFTYVTGQYKSDGITLVQTGETPVSAVLSITTTSGNTTVKVTLPTTGLPTSAVAINIYRTSVGGSDYKLVATVKTGSANYTDSTADASRGSQTPPSSNTTGTTIRMPAQPATSGSILNLSSLGAGVETILTYSATWVNSSGVFYAPYTGVYLFSVNLTTNIAGTSSYVLLNIYKNGTFAYQLDKIVNTSTATIDAVVKGTIVLGLNANDQIYFSATNSSGGNINQANSLFNVVKVN